MGGGAVPPAAADGDDHRSANPPPHGDSMQVIRDALLSQLQKDRLRQEIIVAELARIESAMALRSAFSHHGTAAPSSADPVRVSPAVPLAFREQFVPHGRGTAGSGSRAGDGVDGPCDVDGSVEVKSEMPAVEDLTTCSKTSGSNVKATDECEKDSNENAATDDCKDDSNEAVLPEKTSSSVKWSCAICQVEASSQGNLQQHFAGQKHRVNIIALIAVARAEKTRKARLYAGKKPGSSWVCKFCPANCTGKSDFESHLNGKKHDAKIQALLEECESMARVEAYPNPDMVTQEDEGRPDPVTFCGICQVKCTNPLVKESHLRGKKHQMNVQALQVEAKRLGIIPLKTAKKQQAPLEWDCIMCQAKCNSESQFNDHCGSMGHQQKIEAQQREGTNAQSSGLETGQKLTAGGSNNNGACPEVEIQKALYFCKLCNLQCNSKNTLAEHRQGKKHLEKMEKRMLSSFCHVCSLQCNSEKMLSHHRTGNKHQARLNGLGG